MASHRLNLQLNLLFCVYILCENPCIVIHYGEKNRRSVFFFSFLIDPLGQPTVPAGSDHYFHTDCQSSVRTSVRTFQNLAKQNNKFQAKTMLTTGETVVGLAEWIMDDLLSCYVLFSPIKWLKKVIL